MEPLLGIISLILIIFIAYSIDKRNKDKKIINEKILPGHFFEIFISKTCGGK